MTQRDTIVIGAGITGLTCAFQLRRRHIDAEVLECQNRVGGQIHTFHINGFTFESGPNTGVVKHPEVAELFEQLADKCQLETALESSKRRLIWKDDRFHNLPSSLPTAIATPLFTWKDKLRILGEPWRKRGTDPNESVGSLAERRLGKSYVDYAVDPFLSGVYAGDPYKLPTRLALPKLYRLEQDYGSFIRGSIAKARQPHHGVALRSHRHREVGDFSQAAGHNRGLGVFTKTNAVGDTGGDSDEVFEHTTKFGAHHICVYEGAQIRVAGKLCHLHRQLLRRRCHHDCGGLFAGDFEGDIWPRSDRHPGGWQASHLHNDLAHPFAG